jgi:uncharacterized membrane protein YdjX (TVP38/TMEM64 family)
MRTRLLAVLVAGVVALVYIALGLGYHRQSSACFERRHAEDGDQGALTGVPATVLDVAMWPVFLGFTPADLSCERLPVQRVRGT